MNYTPSAAGTQGATAIRGTVTAGPAFLEGRETAPVAPESTTGTMLYNATPQRPLNPQQNGWNGQSAAYPQIIYAPNNNFQQQNTVPGILPQNGPTNSTTGYVVTPASYNRMPYPQQSRLSDVQYRNTPYYSNEQAANQPPIAPHAEG